MRLLKRLTAALLIAAFAAGPAIPASADLETVGGKTYYLDQNGERVKGWQTIDEKTYYFTENGEMTVKSRVIEGVRYKFGADGVCGGRYTGLTSAAKGRLYWKNGALCKNKWIHSKSGKRLYYAGSDGYLLTGKAEINGEKYVFDKKGKLISGKDKADLIAFYVYDSGDYDEYYQYIYTLDADGYYYHHSTEYVYRGIDLESDGWYEKMLKFKPIENDKWYREAGEKTLKLLADFSKKLEKYAAMPLYDDFEADDDAGVSSAYCIYRDKDGVFRYVMLCCSGDCVACIDSDEVMGFVNMMSKRADALYIFSFSDGFSRETE